MGAFGAEKAADSKSIARGRYIVKIAGCNDCHTPGYFQTGGKVPEKEWLVGDKLGWRGPWGTTYPSNLRAVGQSGAYRSVSPADAVVCLT
jgi:mono/diheme cytochrome c family protein